MIACFIVYFRYPKIFLIGYFIVVILIVNIYVGVAFRQEDYLAVKIIPIEYGRPTYKLVQKQKREEIILGGCDVGLREWDIIIKSPWIAQGR
ncbi:MAG: hypothetical protein V2A78_03015 [bacterium]